MHTVFVFGYWSMRKESAPTWNLLELKTEISYPVQYWSILPTFPACSGTESSSLLLILTEITALRALDYSSKLATKASPIPCRSLDTIPFHYRWCLVVSLVEPAVCCLGSTSSNNRVYCLLTGWRRVDVLQRQLNAGSPDHYGTLSSALTTSKVSFLLTSTFAAGG